MIKFEGKLSPRCQKFIKAQKLKRYYLICIVVFLFIASVQIVNILRTGSAIWLLVIFFNIFIFGAGPLLYIGAVDHRTYIPNVVTVDTELRKILVECKMKKSEREFSSIKKIIDYGEWYKIAFSHEKQDDLFVMQKNLITHGTIEEFEQLFKDKIVPAKSR